MFYQNIKTFHISADLYHLVSLSKSVAQWIKTLGPECCLIGPKTGQVTWLFSNLKSKSALRKCWMHMSQGFQYFYAKDSLASNVHRAFIRFQKQIVIRTRMIVLQKS